MDKIITYKKYKILMLLLILIINSGCSQKVKIRSLEPAEIGRASTAKKVTVMEFKNDRIGLSDKIEAKLSNKKIDSKSYFTMINRKDFNKIIEEQKIQNSGLVDVSTVVEVGNLIGAEAIISGNVGRATSNDTHFLEPRIACADKKCKTFRTYNVRCTKRVVGLSAEIRMVDVTKGDIIYADTMRRTSEYKHCVDDSRAFPSTEIAAQKLADTIAENFTSKLTPHYRFFEVVLLEKPDIDYNKQDEKLLDVSLEYIKQNRFDKAERFLIDLVDATQQKSYVPFYNLGVIKEAQGAYSEAQKYYKMADDLVVEPVEEINGAYVRIQNLIQKSNMAKEQIVR